MDGAPVVADITAVGTGVLGLLREIDARPYVVAAVVTAGHHAEHANGVWLVPKKDLVTGLQLLLQGRRLAIPTTLPDADLLARDRVYKEPRPTPRDLSERGWQALIQGD